ncbi:MAG: DUF2299 domain-containing protein [Sulfolobus sp.]|nr:DUF2299 domain-containing protein [Sulfolobus sp.]
MNPADSMIMDVFKRLGLTVTIPPGAKEAFRIVTQPPNGGPIVEVIRPTPEADFYIIAMGIAVAKEHQDALRSLPPERRREFLLRLKKDILRYEVDMAFLPPDKEVPEAVQISRIVFGPPGGLDPNRLLDYYYKVRNAGLDFMITLADTFRDVRNGGTTYL